MAERSTLPSAGMLMGEQVAQDWNPAPPIDAEEAMRRLAADAQPSDQYYAAWWVGQQRCRHPLAVPLLRRALSQRQPRSLGDAVEPNAVARNAARALGKLGAAAAEAIPELLLGLEDQDYGLREACARSLGQLRASAAVEPLLRRLGSGPDQAGRPQPDSPDLVEPCRAMLEALGEIDQPHAAVLTVVQPFADHPWPVVRSAACRAMLQLSGEARWATLLTALLQHPQLQVRRTVLGDLGATGWRPAAAAISATLAENSLKLIALRALVESRLDDSLDPALLDAMDALL